MRSAALALCAVLAACGHAYVEAEVADAGTAGNDGGPGTPPPGTPPPGSPDAASGPELIAHVGPALHTIATSSNYVYFTSDADNVIYRVPLTGTVASPETFKKMPRAPTSLAVDGKTIFAADSAPSLAALDEDNPAGSGVSVSYAASANDLVVANGGLWWTGQDDQVHKSSSTCASLGTVGALTSPLGIGSDGTHVYAVGSSQGTITRYDIGGAPASLAVNGETDPRALAVVAGGLFWTETTPQKIRAKIGNAGPIDLATNAGNARSIAADATWVYWQNEEGIYRVHRDGTGRERIGDSSWGASNRAVTRTIAVTDVAVYWLDAGRGDVWRLAK